MSRSPCKRTVRRIQRQLSRERDSFTAQANACREGEYWVDGEGNILPPGNTYEPERREGRMAKLTSAARNKLPASKFGQPGKKTYPMPDASHAANAKARAAQQVKKGNLSPASAAKIDAKANKVMGKSKAPKPMGPKLSAEDAHLRGSKHFQAEPPKAVNPKQKAYPEDDGLSQQAKSMSKRFIGG